MVLQPSLSASTKNLIAIAPAPLKAPALRAAAAAPFTVAISVRRRRSVVDAVPSGWNVPTTIVLKKEALRAAAVCAQSRSAGRSACRRRRSTRCLIFGGLWYILNASMAQWKSTKMIYSEARPAKMRGSGTRSTTLQKLTSSAWRARWWRLFAPKPDRRRANARCPCALQLPPRRPQHASAAKGLMSPRFFSAAAFPWRSSMSGWFCLSSEPSKFWRRTRAGIRDAKP